MRPHPASQIAATAALLITLGAAGCAITHPGEARYPGVVEKNPNAAVRAYPASATRVAWALTEVMKKDPILDDVKLVADPQTRDWRGFTHAERQALGFSGMKALQHDVNYNITAKSKDGQKVGVLVLLKGDSGAEVSMLYGAAGDIELSRVLLDQVDAAMVGPLKDPGVAQTGGTRTAAKRPENR